MVNYPTAHIDATPQDFAQTVLMPGDPQRSRFIAETFLDQAKLINNIRGVQGYTGTYQGYPVTVMASGMGMPSIGIYSYELFNYFGVQNIIRIGTAGSLQEHVHVRDIVIGMGASTDSNFANQYSLPGTFAPLAAYPILTKAVQAADKHDAHYHVGNILSSDIFYHDNPTALTKWMRLGVLAVEMECAALYMNAARAQKQALGIFTISNDILSGEETTAEERRTSFTQMMEIALDTAVSLAE